MIAAGAARTSTPGNGAWGDPPGADWKPCPYPPDVSVSVAFTDGLDPVAFGSTVTVPCTEVFVQPPVTLNVVEPAPEIATVGQTVPKFFPDIVTPVYVVPSTHGVWDTPVTTGVLSYT